MLSNTEICVCSLPLWRRPNCLTTIIGHWQIAYVVRRLLTLWFDAECRHSSAADKVPCIALECRFCLMQKPSDHVEWEMDRISTLDIDLSVIVRGTATINELGVHHDVWWTASLSLHVYHLLQLLYRFLFTDTIRTLTRAFVVDLINATRLTIWWWNTSVFRILSSG